MHDVKFPPPKKLIKILCWKTNKQKDTSKVKLRARNIHPGEIKIPALNVELQDASENQSSLNEQVDYNVFFSGKYKQRCRIFSLSLRPPRLGFSHFPTLDITSSGLLALANLTVRALIHFPHILPCMTVQAIMSLKVLLSLPNACLSPIHPSRHTSNPCHSQTQVNPSN